MTIARDAVPMAVPTAGRGRAELLVAAIAALMVALALRSVIAGAFQADDFNLYDTILDPAASEPTVRWGLVLREFVTPFSEAGDRPFFRPLFTLFQAMVIAVVGVDTSALHAVNLVMHALATALVAILAQRITGSRLAALCGALAFGLHVAVVEPVAWISSLNTGLTDTLVLATLVAHVRHVTHHSRSARVLSFLLAGAALLSKESAWVLPAYLFCIELLSNGRHDGWRTFMRRQLGFVPIWLGYLALRFVALGFLGVGRFGAAIDALTDEFVANLPQKALRCVSPWPWADGGVALWIASVLPTAACIALLVLGVSRLSRRSLVILVPMFLCGLVPGFANFVGWNWSGSRVLYAALIPLSLAFAVWCSAAFAKLGRVRWLAFACTLVILGAEWSAQGRQLDTFVASWQADAELGRALVARRGSAMPSRPLVLLVTPLATSSAPSFLPPLLHLAASKPFADVDVPALGMTYVLSRLMGQEEFAGDASLPRAMAAAGSTLLAWIGGTDLAPVPVGPIELPALVDGTWTTTGAPIPALAFQSIEVTSTAEVERWETYVTGLSIEKIDTVVQQSRAGGTTRATLDVSRDLRLLVFGALGGIRGIEVRAFDRDGQRVAISAAKLVAGVPELASRTRLDGMRAGVEPRIVAPLVDGTAPLRIVLLGGGTAAAQLVVPGQPIEWNESAQRFLRARARTDRLGVVFCFFDRAGVVPGRSRLDHWRVR